MGAVRRDDDDVKLVDVPEFACLGLCRTRHTRELVVHTEVVLQRDGGEGLGSSLDVDALLSFDSLVQAIGVAAAVMIRPVCSSTIMTLLSMTTYWSSFSKRA